MCRKRVSSAKYRVLAPLTSFLLKKTALKRKEMLVLALVSLIQQYSMRLHVSQCVFCFKSDIVYKTRFRREILRLHVSQCFHCVKTDIVHKTRF